MFRLHRLVRFGINREQPDAQWQQKPANSFGGYPSLTGFGGHYAVEVTVKGSPEAASQYVMNIREIDDATRDVVRELVPVLTNQKPSDFVRLLFGAFEELWRERFEAVALLLSPTLRLEMTHRDLQVDLTMRLSQKFEFSASHRLHNPSLTDDENRNCFGKCNNPHGHGHNYELQVTLRGTPGKSGLIIDIPTFERAVAETVIEKFDHKNLNVELAEFKELIPSVENIAMVIYRLLKPKLDSSNAQLASVTVWETPKTWCEYSE